MRDCSQPVYAMQWKSRYDADMNRTFRQVKGDISTIFTVPGIGRMKSIYCRCGNIIRIDSAQVNLKLALGKELECPKCRNARISKDIDEIEMHFNGIEVEECDSF